MNRFAVKQITAGRQGLSSAIDQGLHDHAEEAGYRSSIVRVFLAYDRTSWRRMRSGLTT